LHRGGQRGHGPVGPCGVGQESKHVGHADDEHRDGQHDANEQHPALLGNLTVACQRLGVCRLRTWARLDHPVTHVDDLLLQIAVVHEGRDELDRGAFGRVVDVRVDHTRHLFQVALDRRRTVRARHAGDGEGDLLSICHES